MSKSSESDTNAAIWRKIARSEPAGSAARRNATKMANKTDRDGYKAGRK
jgi:hypothetical protein